MAPRTHLQALRPIQVKARGTTLPITNTLASPSRRTSQHHLQPRTEASKMDWELTTPTRIIAEHKVCELQVRRHNPPAVDQTPTSCCTNMPKAERQMDPQRLWEQTQVNPPSPKEHGRRDHGPHGCTPRQGTDAIQVWNRTLLIVAGLLNHKLPSIQVPQQRGSPKMEQHPTRRRSQRRNRGYATGTESSRQLASNTPSGT